MESSLVQHFSFVAVALVLYAVTWYGRTKIWTAKLAAKNKVFAMLRDASPLHPVVLGALLGLSLRAPAIGESSGLAHSVMYFAAAGVASTWVYDATKKLIYKRIS